MNINPSNWPIFAQRISGDSKPEEYNEAAVDRLMDVMDDYVVRVKGVRPQFDARNSIERIFFQNREEAQYYEDTERRYLEKKAKLAERLGIDFDKGGGIWALVLLNERCRAAEYCRRYHIAQKMRDAVASGKYAAVAAVKNKNTLIAVVRILVEEYGISRDSISLVWGGAPSKANEKQKARAEIKKNEEALKLAGVNVDELLKTLDLEYEDDVVDEELPKHLRLGAQSREERQKEIDRFQSGRSLFCIYTFKAGGVGLSLHHTDEMTTQWDSTAPGYAEWRIKIDDWNMRVHEKNRVAPGKCRRKESGYAFEEDIPFIPVRPRINYVAPTYSAIELVQALGRCPRLTSLSDTIQKLLFYGGTVEDGVARVVSVKLRCLSKVVRQKEKWEDVITVGNSGRAVEEHIEKTANLADDSPDDLGGEEEEEE
jgi:hypothetical protein